MVVQTPRSAMGLFSSLYLIFCVFLPLTDFYFYFRLGSLRAEQDRCCAE